VYSLEWLALIGVVGVVVGGTLGYLVAGMGSKSAVRIRELETELEAAHSELSDYRQEVHDQFAETARKFKSLDESYSDLYRQLADSASVLCGEAAGPLLAAPSPVGVELYGTAEESPESASEDASELPAAGDDEPVTEAGETEAGGDGDATLTDLEITEESFADDELADQSEHSEGDRTIRL